MLSLAKSCGFAYAVCNTIVILCVSPVKGGEMEIRMIISISASEHLRQKKEEERTVIFLDIDGVLQPCLSQKRFDHDLSETREMVARETGNSKYLQKLGGKAHGFNRGMKAKKLFAIIGQ